MPRLLHPRPMSEFDPDRLGHVHDQLKDKVIDWDPAWAENYNQYVRYHEPGVVEWDGLLLDGWEPLGQLN